MNDAAPENVVRFPNGRRRPAGGNADLMIEHARDIAEGFRAGGDQNRCGYYVIAIEPDGSYRSAFRTGDAMGAMLFSMFVMEAVRRDIITSSEVRHTMQSMTDNEDDGA